MSKGGSWRSSTTSISDRSVRTGFAEREVIALLVAHAASPRCGRRPCRRAATAGRAYSGTAYGRAAAPPATARKLVSPAIDDGRDVVHLDGDLSGIESPAAVGSGQEHVQAWPRPANRDIWTQHQWRRRQAAGPNCRANALTRKTSLWLCVTRLTIRRDERSTSRRRWRDMNAVAAINASKRPRWN